MTGITLIATGGTIASSRAEGDDRVRANRSGEDLKRSLHAPLDGIDLSVTEFSSVGSFAMDVPLAFNLSGAIEAALAEPGCDGVVVTHGTDTMEESCYLAHLLRRTDKPIVFTGAQRHAGDPDTDGPRNLADAIRVAAAPEAAGLGATLLFEQEIHAARDVRKMHTSRVDTFRSPGLGKLGEIDEGRVILHRRPLTGPSWQIDRPALPVELIKLSMGCSPWMLEAAVDRGACGVVLEAFGRGNAPPAFTEAIAAATAQDIPVIVASRCAEGETRPVYGGRGGGRDLIDAGAILAGSLSGVKSRLLLSVLLGAGQSREQIAENWARH